MVHDKSSYLCITTLEGVSPRSYKILSDQKRILIRSMPHLTL